MEYQGSVPEAAALLAASQDRYAALLFFRKVADRSDAANRLDAERQEWLESGGDSGYLYAAWVQAHLPTEQIERVIALASKTFDDADYAKEFLNRPNAATDGKAPITLLGTEDGLKRVETLIHRLAHGIVA